MCVAIIVWKRKPCPTYILTILTCEQITKSHFKAPLIQESMVQRPPKLILISSDLSKIHFVQNFKVSILSKFCIYLVQTSCPADHLLVSNETLSCETRNISTLTIVVYHKAKNFCLILKVSHALVCSVHFQGFKWFCWSILTSSFRSFTIPHCYLNLIIFIYIFVIRII